MMTLSASLLGDILIKSKLHGCNRIYGRHNYTPWQQKYISGFLKIYVYGKPKYFPRPGSHR